jgi:hypothetical protein
VPAVVVLFEDIPQAELVPENLVAVTQAAASGV